MLCNEDMSPVTMLIGSFLSDLTDVFLMKVFFHFPVTIIFCFHLVNCNWWFRKTHLAEETLTETKLRCNYSNFER